MMKDNLPPITFNVSPNALRPTESYKVDQALWDRVQRLKNQGEFRTALQEILNFLDQNPNDEGTLRLAAITIGGSRSDQLQAEEPIPPGMLGDTRLDPIFTQCSQCKNAQWVSINWLLDLGGTMSVTSPVGLQCQECGYVMCRDCLKTIESKFGIGYSTYSNVCPNCGRDALGTPVYPTGRTSMQMKHIKGTLSRVLIFREGPLVPDGDYLKEILENVYPEALNSGVIYSAFPVSPWPEEISFYAFGVALAHGIQMDEFDQANGQDMDGNRLYFMRIYQAKEASISKEIASTEPVSKPIKTVVHKETWWKRFREKTTVSISRLFSTKKSESAGGDGTSQSDLTLFVDNLIKRHMNRMLEGERPNDIPKTVTRKLLVT